MIFGSGTPPVPYDRVTPDSVPSSPTPSATLARSVSAPRPFSTARNWSKGDVLRLAAVDAAAGEDGAGGVVTVGAGEQIEALDDQDAVLEALAVGRRVVERGQRTVGVPDIEVGLRVAALHRPVLGGQAVRVIERHQLQRLGLLGAQRPLQHGHERRGGRGRASGAQEGAARRAAHHCALRWLNSGLRTSATTASMTSPSTAALCFQASTKDVSLGTTSLPEKPVAARKSWRAKHSRT